MSGVTRTESGDDDAIRETVEYVAVRRLQDAYADVVTRRAWPELRDLFLADAVVEVDTRRGDPMRFVGPDALGEFIGPAIADFDFFEFVILNTRIELGAGGDADAAAGRMYMCELRHDRETDRWMNAFGVYHDRYRRQGGRWWFEHRRYHSLARAAGQGTETFDFPDNVMTFRNF